VQGEYREELYQWIWEKLEFKADGLQTTDGEVVRIIENGARNQGAGPDFSAAHILIGGRRWFGSVEIHKTAAEWRAHGHHEDPAYNRVILHVVVEENGPLEVLREDGTSPPTMLLKPYLNKRVYNLLRKMGQPSLACGGKTALIHQRAFEIQVEKAHAEYLDYKVEELLSGYDPSLKISEAWKSALILQVYRTLGIPSNREPMGELASLLTQNTHIHNRLKSFINEVEARAFGKSSDRDFGWVRSGMRPANRPQKRVKQAAAIHWHLEQYSLDFFYKHSPKASWNTIINSIEKSFLPGARSLGILYATVFIPALHLLGRLLQYRTLTDQTSAAWASESFPVPRAVQRPFRDAGFEIDNTLKKIGLAHQYKRYCKEQQCHRCEVFKSAIHS
jgi:hypothetical protein